MALNKVMIIGNLGNDPDVKYTPSGAAVANFSVATNESWTNKDGQKQEKVEWHRVTVWGKLAEVCKEYLHKGKQVYVEGKLQTRQWDDKEGVKRYTTEIVASQVQFLGSAGQGANRAPHPADAGAAPGGSASFTEDDIPF